MKGLWFVFGVRVEVGVGVRARVRVCEAVLLSERAEHKHHHDDALLFLVDDICPIRERLHLWTLIDQPENDLFLPFFFCPRYFVCGLEKDFLHFELERSSLVHHIFGGIEDQITECMNCGTSRT